MRYKIIKRPTEGRWQVKLLKELHTEGFTEAEAAQKANLLLTAAISELNGAGRVYTNQYRSPDGLQRVSIYKDVASDTFNDEESAESSRLLLEKAIGACDGIILNDD